MEIEPTTERGFVKGGRWVGQPLKRREDPEILTGQARFIGDLVRPGMLHAAFLRSLYPHARIRQIDVSRARLMPGVHCVWSAADLPANLPPQPYIQKGWVQRDTPYFALTRDKVRYAGEPVAVVVADSAYLAEDALEQIDVDWELLPSVGRAEDALKPDAPRLFEDWPDNVAGTFHAEMGDVDRGLAEAEVRVTERFHVGRQFACPLEPRGVLAEWDPLRSELIFWSSTQVHQIVRNFLGTLLNLPETQIRVLTPRVGGGFGAKFHFYPEETTVALLARHLRRPVRWLEDRVESFISTVHAREQVIEVTLGARRDGTITALSAHVIGDMGGYLHSMSYGPVWLTSVLITGAYKIDNARVDMQAVLTNKTPYGSFRGWGHPKATFAIERMMDRLALALALDPVEVRRKNFIPPEAFPHQTLHHVMDSAEFAGCLDKALGLADYAGWRQRQADLRQQGRYIGIGIGYYVEETSLGPSRALNYGGVFTGGYDTSHIRVEPSGEVTVFTGFSDIGQGFVNGFIQICADTLGVHPDRVRVVHGDTQVAPYSGFNTGSSRSAAVGGGAVLKACRRLRDKIEAIAAHMLEAEPADLVLEDGQIWTRQNPGHCITMADVGHAAYIMPIKLPPGKDPGLEAIEVFDPPWFTCSNGANVAVVEVDVHTGKVEFHNYVFVHDCGTILNQLVVEGQVVGGAAMGIAAALFEELGYDDNGQPLTGSFMDYHLPRAADLPRLTLDHVVVPSPNIPGGMKGVGESGEIAPPAAVTNAVEDALRPFGVKFTRIPLTPDVILSALAAARAAGG